MASCSNESFIIEKLNSNNCAIWSFKIQMLLMKENLFNNITDDPPTPLNTDSTKKGQ